MSDDQDFSQHPQSIGEIRASKTPRASEWRGRDAIIDVLREIDRGTINPESLVIVWREGDHKEGWQTFFRNAGADPHATQGMLLRALYLMNLA